ncbi:MAG: S41 family peptidase [Rhodanobacter sp.]
MHRSFIHAVVASCAIACAAPAVHAQVAWRVTGSGAHDYQVTGSGDPASGQGATVALRSGHAGAGKFGASVASLDAAPYRGHTVMLSADLATRDVAKSSLIWLRADGPNGKLAFANSGFMPVTGTTSASHREVRIDVPTAATKLLIGTTLEGNGEVIASGMRLTQVASSPSASIAPERVLDAAIRLVRARALRAADVDWNSVEPKVRAMANGAKVPSDVYPAIRALLAALGDHHSLFMEPWRSHQQQIRGGPSAAPVVALKQDGIGYIVMPGYNGMDPAARKAFVTAMVDAIGNIAPQARRGWIVDLRDDTGGSMLPMLAGLRPLLGERPVGSFRNNKGNLFPFSAASPLDAGLPTGPDLQQLPVAVITGPRTASSGEVVAVAFRGRPATRSFGQPTAGLSTGNAGLRLPDGSTIFLTESVDVDRDGHAYGGKLLPDEPVAASGDAAHDAPLAAAMSWLKHRPAGSR